MSVEVISTYTEGDTLPVMERNYDDGGTDITSWTITLHIKRPGVPALKAALSTFQSSPHPV